MTNYLIYRGGALEHYFFRPYEGICVRKQNSMGVWQQHINLFEKGKDGFGVYADLKGLVHIIASDEENKLIYILYDGTNIKKYVISKLNSDIFINDMRLYSISGRLNMLYSAFYNGENLLVHCILGDRAKPSTVDVMNSPDFCIFNEKVYYTNTNQTLGSVSLSDEKPSEFIPIYENAHSGTVYNINDKERILFVRDSKIFLDDTELIYDSRVEMPVIAECKNKYYIMWKSGGYIRYIASTDGNTLGEPMRFMNTGSLLSLYSVQKGENFYNYYGYQNAKDIVFLGNPKIFEPSPVFDNDNKTELDRLRDALNETRRDIKDTQKELARLGEVIGSLSDRQ